jgi:hypothetical protein
LSVETKKRSLHPQLHLRLPFLSPSLSLSLSPFPFPFLYLYLWRLYLSLFLCLFRCLYLSTKNYHQKPKNVPPLPLLFPVFRLFRPFRSTVPDVLEWSNREGPHKMIVSLRRPITGRILPELRRVWNCRRKKGRKNWQISEWLSPLQEVPEAEAPEFPISYKNINFVF